VRAGTAATAPVHGSQHSPRRDPGLVKQAKRESEAQDAGLRLTHGTPQRVNSGSCGLGAAHPSWTRAQRRRRVRFGSYARERRGRRLGSAAAAPPPDAAASFGFQRRRPAGRCLLVVALAAQFALCATLGGGRLTLGSRQPPFADDLRGRPMISHWIPPRGGRHGDCTPEACRVARGSNPVATMGAGWMRSPLPSGESDSAAGGRSAVIAAAQMHGKHQPSPGG
jgi:hypothetical protein